MKGGNDHLNVRFGVPERLRVLLVQPSLQPPGGGNAVSAWMLQALKDRHDVTALTWWPADVQEVNAYYGTTIAPSDFTAIEVWPRALRAALDLWPTPISLLKSSLTLRSAAGLTMHFDVVVSAFNEAPLGRSSIQYIHYPAYLRPRPPADIRTYHLAPFLWVYYAVADHLARYSRDRVVDSVTLANSRWTAEKFRERYGPAGPVRVVFPPVAPVPAGKPWAERTNAFVCVGRISPEKELERVASIIRRVRERVPDAELHIIGSADRSRYAARIRRLAERHSDWLFLHTNVTREGLLERIGTSRYAIHGMREEHFGIAPAESASGGCIVFVPDGGGQVDIVGDEPALRYSTEEDAAEKIVRVMTSAEEQRRLTAHLASRAALFSASRFMSTIVEVVNDLAARQGGPIVASARAESDSAAT
jgi:glycosyltransferase involved in cell wall biosynthesis